MTSTSAPTPHTRAPRPWSLAILRHLVHAEARKLPCSPAWWVLLILVVGCAALNPSHIGDVETPETTLQVVLAGWSTTVAAMYGAICITSEYRHRSIATSHLIAANRPALILAKMVFAALVGAAYALIAATTSLIAMALHGLHIGSELPQILGVIAVGIPVVALFGILGVGFGALVGKQLPAVLLSPYSLWLLQFLFQFVVDHFKLLSLSDAETYLPIVTMVYTITESTGGPQIDGSFAIGPPWWLEPLLLTSSVVLIAAAGIARAQRRDIK